MHVRTAAMMLAAACGSAGAQTISLDTGLLPSQQPGWVYRATNNDAAVAETSVFSTDGTTLTSNTMALPFAGGRPASTYAEYDLSSIDFTEVTSITMDLRARVLASEVAQFNYGFYVSVYGGGQGFSTGFGSGTLTPNNQANIAFDATEWHDYRWVADWTAGTVELFADGQLLDSRLLVPQNSTTLNIGDGTGTANAHAEIESFQIRIVPAPASAALLGLGGLATLRRRR